MLAEYKSPIASHVDVDCTLIFKCKKTQHVVLDVRQFDLPNNCQNYLLLDWRKQCSSSNFPEISTIKDKLEIGYHADQRSFSTTNGFLFQLQCKGLCISFNNLITR